MKIFVKITLASVCLVSASFAQAALAQGRPQPGPTCQRTGPSWYPVSSSDLNNALTCSQPGDTIFLHAGSVYAGPFKLPAKTQATTPQSVTITTDAPVAQDGMPGGSGLLPGAGIRVSPNDKPAMPTITTSTSANSSNSAITTATAASYYKFVGVEITTNYFVYNVVQLGTASEKSASDLPHHITFDRCYIHGSASAGSRRGINANGGQGVPSGTTPDLSTGSIEDLVFTNSYFADFNDPSNDAQAILAYNGYGPFKIINNYLEASGENLMFGGGADPSIRYLVPSNITIKNNHFYKPIAWMADSSKWVKNLFELKNASGVWVENNVFENNWVNQQKGIGIQFTPRNQNGSASWAVVQHVTFVGNIINNTPGGFNILGYDDIHNSQQLNDVTIKNNLLLNIGNRSYVINGLTYTTCGTNTLQCGRMTQVDNASKGVTFDHNTSFNTASTSYSWTANPNQLFTMTNNVVVHGYCAPGSNYCGISGDNAQPGNTAIAMYFASPVNISYNVLQDGNEAGTYSYSNVGPQNYFTGPAGSSSYPADPAFAPDYTQSMYIGSDNVTPMGINSTVWPIYSKVVQVTSDGGM